MLPSQGPNRQVVGEGMGNDQELHIEAESRRWYKFNRSILTCVENRATNFKTRDQVDLDEGAAPAEVCEMWHTDSLEKAGSIKPSNR